MTRFTPTERLLVVIGLIWFGALASRYHGFSVGAWQRWIEMPTKGTLLSTPRFTRGDDWAHDIPYALSQIRSGFAVVNPFVGLGQNMLLPNKVPVWHPVTLGRPSTWGYWLGADWGLSWAWCFLAFGTLLSAYFLFQNLSGGQATLSAGLALALLFSPTVQFWSYHKMEIFIHSVGFLLCLRAFLEARTAPLATLWGLACAYMLLCFLVHNVYPGLQVAYGYSGAALFLTFCLSGEWKPSHHVRQWKLVVALAGLSAVCLVLVLTCRDAWQAITQIQEAVYPGQRVSTGGAGYPWLVLSSNFFVATFLRQSFGPFGNVSESASAIHFAPVAILASAFAYRRGYRRLLQFLAPTIALIALFLFYVWMGFPLWLAKLSLFGKLTENRVPQILFFLEFIVLCRFLADTQVQGILQWRDRLATFTVWTCMLGVLGFFLVRHSALTPLNVLASLAVNATLTFLLLYTKVFGRRAFLAAFILMSAGYTSGFNPVHWGRSTQFLYRNPISEKMVLLSQESEAAFWAVVGSEGQSIFLANLPRILGVRSAAGAVGTPQLELWSRFAPHADPKLYNRLAYTYFVPGAQNGEPRLENPTPNQLAVHIHPDSPAWSRVGLTHVLALDSFELWERSPHWRSEGCIAGYCFYARR